MERAGPPTHKISVDPRKDALQWMRHRHTRVLLSKIALTGPAIAAMQSAPLPRVLSIQSHVVHGCVGNRAASFPLQLLGVETDVLNTVQYSNHVGYGSFAGEKLSGDQVWELLQGMHKNNLLTPSRVLTGYMGSVEAVRAVVRALPLLKDNQHDFQFWCDPVLGDNGRLYVPKALVDVYRDEVVPHAHALLPNQFEAEVLSGVTIRTVADARTACAALHRRGVNLVMITSSELVEQAPMSNGAVASSPPLTVLLSRKQHAKLWRREYRIDVPQLPHHFAGTGDLLAALFLGWDMRPGVSSHAALRRALAGVQSVLHRTVACATPTVNGENEGYGSGTRPLGLRLLESIDSIRTPEEDEIAAPTRLDHPLAGVVFDMDGTLTMPGQLDFARMRKAAGLAADVSILEGIEALPTEKRADAWSAIEAIEAEAFECIELQPGLVALIEALRSRGVRLAIATRNNANSVTTLLRKAGLPADTFDPILTRDSPHPDKPDPAIAIAASKAWRLPPEACAFVGDSLDDMRCGRAAGMATCFISPAPPVPNDDIDCSISSLSELTDMIDDAVATD